MGANRDSEPFSAIIDMAFQSITIQTFLDLVNLSCLSTTNGYEFDRYFRQDKVVLRKGDVFCFPII